MTPPLIAWPRTCTAYSAAIPNAHVSSDLTQNTATPDVPSVGRERQNLPVALIHFEGIRSRERGPEMSASHRGIG
jgi:hypothetical protein